MSGKRIGYIRVSSLDQNPDRQLEGIQLDKRFVDYATGKNMDRPQLIALKGYAREEDIVIVHSMDRIGRKVKDILNLVDYFLDNGIQVQFLKENLNFTSKTDPVANCILTIFAAVAEFEYSLIKERQLEGIAIAKKLGRKNGRPKSFKDEHIEEVKRQLENGKPKTKISKDMGVSRFTLYKYLKEIKQQLKT